MLKDPSAFMTLLPLQPLGLTKPPLMRVQRISLNRTFRASLKHNRTHTKPHSRNYSREISGVTEYAQDTNNAWTFWMDKGSQGWERKNIWFYALAVRPGQVAVVPEADTWAMLLAGLGLIGVLARQRRR